MKLNCLGFVAVILVCLGCSTGDGTSERTDIIDAYDQDSPDHAIADIVDADNQDPTDHAIGGEDVGIVGQDTADEVNVVGDTADDTAEEDVASNVQPPMLPGAVSVEVLDTIDMEYGEVALKVLLLKLECGDLRPAYAQWIEVQGLDAPAPVVVQTMPYDTIDWTGESVDEQQAAIQEPLTPEKFVEQSFLYPMHDYHVLGIFGRFYTGDSIMNDVQDMLMGLSYLKQESDADLDNIVIWGASWGGFEALYGSAYAPQEVRPKAGMALAPVGDFALQARFWTDFVEETITAPEKLQEHQNFREAYLTRIYATTSGHPDEPESDYTYWNTQAVADRIDMPFLLVHDTWDSLVPFGSSESLAEACDAFDVFWVEPDGKPDWNTLPLDHGLYLGNFTYPASLTFAVGYVLHAVARPEQTVIIPFEPAAIRNLLKIVYDRQQHGTAREWMPERLVDLTGPTVILFDVTEGLEPLAGAGWMAEQINDIWQTDLTADNVAAWIVE